MGKNKVKHEFVLCSQGMLQVGMHRIMTIFACSLQTLCLLSLRILNPIESMMINDETLCRSHEKFMTVQGPKIHFSTLIQDYITIQTLLSPFGHCFHFLFPSLTFLLFPCYNLLRLCTQLIDLLPQFLPLSSFSPMDFWSWKPTCSAVQATDPL